MASLAVSVEYVEVAMSSVTPVEVDLTKGQDYTKCSVHYTVRATAELSDVIRARAINVRVVDSSTNPGTAAVVCFRHTGLSGSLVVCIFVVEWSSACAVQLVGPFNTMLSGVSTLVKDVADVGDQRRTIILPGYSIANDANSDDHDDSMVQFTFNGASTSQLFMDRGSGSVGDIVASIYLITCRNEEFVVDHQVVDVTDGTAIEVEKSITPVSPGNTFLIHTYKTSHASDDQDAAVWVADLKDPATLRIRRTNSDPTVASSTSSHAIQVVTATRGHFTVQRNPALALDAATKTDPLVTAIDQERAIINNLADKGQHSGAGRNDSTDGVEVDSAMAGASFSGDAEIQYVRKDTTTTPIVSYEVIQFEDPGDDFVTEIDAIMHLIMPAA